MNLRQTNAVLAVEVEKTRSIYNYDSDWMRKCGSPSTIEIRVVESRFKEGRLPNCQCCSSQRAATMKMPMIHSLHRQTCDSDSAVWLAKSFSKVQNFVELAYY